MPRKLTKADRIHLLENRKPRPAEPEPELVEKVVSCGHTMLVPENAAVQHYMCESCKRQAMLHPTLRNT